MNKEFREGKEFKWFFQGLCCLIVYTAVKHVNDAKHKRHRGLPKTLPIFFRSMKQVWKRKTLQHAKSCNARFKLFFFFLRGVVSLFVAAYSSLLSWFLFSSYSVYFLSQIKIKCGKRRKETKKKKGERHWPTCLEEKWWLFFSSPFVTGPDVHTHEPEKEKLWVTRRGLSSFSLLFRFA